MLDFLAKEFDHLALPIDSGLCVWLYLRSNNFTFDLPCCHTIGPGQKIDLETIHLRWPNLDPVASPP